jgi:tetratricopeptide (TPR) repeat protein
MYIIHLEGIKQPELRGKAMDRLVDVFGIPKAKAESLLGQLPTVFRRVESIDEAAQVVGALDKIGLLIRLERDDSLSPEQKKRIVQCPVCKNDQVKSARCLYCGEPFEKEAPKAFRPKVAKQAPPTPERKFSLAGNLTRIPDKKWIAGIVLLGGLAVFANTGGREEPVVQKKVVVLPTPTPRPTPLEPGEVKQVYETALAHRDGGRLDRAAYDLHRVTLTAPGHYEAHRALSEVLLELDRFREAAAAMEAMVRLRPENESLLIRLAWLHLEREIDVNRAFQIGKKLYRENPDSPEVLDLLAVAYFKRGNLTLARNTILEAASRDPSSEQIQDHYRIIHDQWEKTRP